MLLITEFDIRKYVLFDLKRPDNSSHITKPLIYVKNENSLMLCNFASNLQFNITQVDPIIFIENTSLLARS